MKLHPYHIMGILNVTPDSFSDGGQFVDVNKAVDHAFMLWEQGADSIDIGGESTRPNSDVITPQQEIDRILPVIETLKSSRPDIVLSIDTRNSETMRAALNYDIDMINDVSALTHDPLSLEVLKTSNVHICLMHMRGTPQTMQQDTNYDDLVQDIKSYLQSRIDVCTANGIDQSRLWIDVGIGFGKTTEQNLDLMRALDEFQDLGCPILLGASRKSFIDKISNAPDPSERLGGSLAAVINAYELGVQAFRVHDVYETKQALDIWHAITES